MKFSFFDLPGNGTSWAVLPESLNKKTQTIENPKIRASKQFKILKDWYQKTVRFSNEAQNIISKICLFNALLSFFNIIMLKLMQQFFDSFWKKPKSIQILKSSKQNFWCQMAPKVAQTTTNTQIWLHWTRRAVLETRGLRLILTSF